jgi:MerR family transcriptional regulator/heat shock protein HspR
MPSFEFESRGVYVISVAAELAGVHPQTLRIYERKGLLEPSRTGGGSRRYSERDIARLRRILDLTNEGLNLAGVKRVMELEDEITRLKAELASAKEAARDAVERTHRHYRRDLVPVSQAPVLNRRRCTPAPRTSRVRPRRPVPAGGSPARVPSR